MAKTRRERPQTETEEDDIVLPILDWPTGPKGIFKKRRQTHGKATTKKIGGVVFVSRK